MLHNRKIEISTNERDCGRFGDAFEMSVSGRDYVQKQAAIDLYFKRKHIETKTGAGELGRPGEKLLKGYSKVMFVPVPVPEPDGTLYAGHQEGFLFTREKFLETLDDLGLIRYSKMSTAGTEIVSIQTFWNRKQNKPHSRKKYNMLMDALYENCIITLEDLLEKEGLL